MKILITGGAGYIGSSICYALEDNGYELIILDSLVSGKNEFISTPYFYCGDIADKELLKKIFQEHNDIEIAIHCAERSAVSLSVGKPYEFYTSNVVKSMEFFKTLSDIGCKKIIFASSAAIYDDVPGYMVTEKSPIRPRSPFAKTKYMSEMILKDFCEAYDMKCIVLRYFNAVGADPQSRSGLHNSSNAYNIIENLIKILNGESHTFKIAGNDWETRDGTCMRDFIHIHDLALANVQAVKNFDKAFESAGSNYNNFLPLNIGSGVGVTVMEFIFAFENVTGEKINIVFTNRRPGDVGGSYANVSLAKKTIDWEAKSSLEDAIIDAVKWDEKRRELFK